MATNTFVALDKATVAGSSTTTITFTNINQGYTDLVLINNSKCSNTSTGAAITLVFNADGGSNYSQQALEGNGSTTTAERYSNTTFIDGGRINTSNGSNSNWGMGISHIQNYSSATMYKNVLTRSSVSNEAWPTYATTSTWRNNAAITSITITCGYTFTAGTTFSLYGIKSEAASPTPKATGGAIYQDSTYYYHVFGSTAAFVPNQALTADVLVVAGGGGGGGWLGGGGGAGGLLGFTSQSLSATSYTCTVGAGGAKSASNNSPGSNGGDSQFGALTLVKGGGYGGVYTGAGGSVSDGNTGGSGGGGGGQNGYTGYGGSATSGQGYAGGNSGVSYRGGGGGGAGGAGGAGTSTATGSGGIGSTTYSSWGIATGVGQNITGTYYLAGGGSGGTNQGGTENSGGYGGGGSTLGAKDGMANTGGGGAGAQDTSNSGKGGSGVIIVRYAK